MTLASGKLVIGLAGGIGSGKSAVARILGELGAAVIESDRLNREELDDPEVVETLVSWFGPRLVDSQRRLRRDALAELVFGVQGQRTRVEGLLHPRVAARRRELSELHRRDPNVRFIVIDSPLLFEVGLDRECDVVVFVDAPLERRRERVARERGWSAAELSRREKLQKALDSKKGQADHILANNSGLDDLRARVEELLPTLLADAAGR